MSTKQLLQDSEQQRKALLSILEDQKRVEEKLQKSQEYNRLLFISSPIGLALCRMDGSLVDINPAYANLLGRTIVETLKLTYWDITPDEYASLEALQLKSLEETGSYGPYEKEYIHKDGHLVPVRLRGQIIERDGEKFIWSSVEDITERKRAEEKEKEYLNRINNILESVSDAFVSLDTNWCYTYMNKKAGEIFNRKPEEMIGKNIWAEFPEGIGQPFQLNYEKVMNEKVFIRMEEYYPPYDRWFENRINPTEDGIAIFFTDITERKKAEEELKTLNEELFELNKTITLSSSTLDIKILFDKLLGQVVEIIGLEGGTICTIGHNNTLELVAHRETSDATITDLTENKIKVGDCLCGNCANDKCPLILWTREDVLRYSTREVTRGEDIRFHAAFPLLVKDNCVGVLCVFTRTDKKPGKRKLRLLETITRQISISIENATFYKDLLESEEKFSKIFKAAPGSMILSSLPDGKTIEVNNNFSIITGYTREEALGKTTADLNMWADSSARDRFLSLLQQNGVVRDFEADLNHKSGTIRNGLVSSYVFTIQEKKYLIGTFYDITERKKVEEELRKSYEKTKELEAIINRSPAVAFLWRAEENWPVEYVSENILQFGYTPEELMTGKLLFSKMVYHEDLEHVAQEVNHYSKSGVDEFVQEYRIITKSGNVRYVDDLTWIRRDKNKKITHYQGIILDITKRKLAEKALLESERLLSEAQRIARMGSWAFYLDGRIFWSQEMYRVYGVAPETFIPNEESFMNLIHPEDKPLVKEWIRACSNGEKPGEIIFRSVLPDGSIRYIKGLGELVTDSENRLIYLSGTAQDITKLKTAEETVKESERRFTEIMKSVNLASLILDSNGNISFCNRYLLDLTGYAAEEVLNKNWFDLFIPKEILEDVKRVFHYGILNNSLPTHVENEIVAKDGVKKLISWNNTVLKDTVGNIIGAASIGEDITEQKRLEKELFNHSEQLRALTAHLEKVKEEERASIARELHDELGQILTSLKMNIAFTRRELEESNSIEMKNKILTEFQFMNLTIDKAVSRVRKLITQLRPELLDKLGLIAALEWYAEEYTKRTNIKCVFTTECEELVLNHDLELAVFRIIQEAMTNTAKHSEAESVQIRLCKRENKFSVEIIDDGKGILESDLEGNTSFGLMGMRERANIIGGNLEIFGSPGKGTTVRLLVGF